MSDGSPSGGSTGRAGPQGAGPFGGSDGTGSDPAWDRDRSLSQRTLDALVFAPAGFLLSAVEDLPEMAAKGRERLEVQLRNAHVVGRFAVAIGQRRLKEQLDRFGGEDEQAMGVDDDPVADHVEAPATVPPPPFVVEVPPGDAFAVPDGGSPVDLAIPDYDTLSASQVVRRLDGLGAHDLEAVFRHEAATRRRRTILHRAQQLLGVEDAPGSDGSV